MDGWSTRIPHGVDFMLRVERVLPTEDARDGRRARHAVHSNVHCADAILREVTISPSATKSFEMPWWRRENLDKGRNGASGDTRDVALTDNRLVCQVEVIILGHSGKPSC